MNIVVTGGAGFLGIRLARALLAQETLPDAEGRPLPLASLTLVDLFHPADPVLLADPRVRVVTGDLATLLAAGGAVIAPHTTSVFHLAAAVSGECEANFDLGLRVNFDTTRALLEACRHVASRPRLIFASSVAVFGGELPAVVDDFTLPQPQNSYGIQKFMCEQLIADYSRKGFVDGRSVRLPTISVRPGKPNAAASSFLSGIVREPLAGQEATCPVPLDMRVSLLSPRGAVRGLMTALTASGEQWGQRIAMNLPALTVSVGAMIEALRSVAGEQAVSRIRYASDANIQCIVGSWPAGMTSARALALGLAADPDFETIVRGYMEDNPQALAGH